MGPTAPIISYWGAVQWLARGTDICQEGYNKVGTTCFDILRSTVLTSFIVQGQGVQGRQLQPLARHRVRPEAY